MKTEISYAFPKNVFVFPERNRIAFFRSGHFRGRTYCFLQGFPAEGNPCLCLQYDGSRPKETHPFCRQAESDQRRIRESFRLIFLFLAPAQFKEYQAIFYVYIYLMKSDL